MQAVRAVCELCFSLYEDASALKAVQWDDGMIVTGDFGLLVKYLRVEKKEVKWLVRVRIRQRIRQVFKAHWGHRRFFVVLLGCLLAEIEREEMDFGFLREQLDSTYTLIEEVLRLRAVSLDREADLIEVLVPGFASTYGPLALNMLEPNCLFEAVKGCNTPSVEVASGLIVHVFPQVIQSLHNLSISATLLPNNITSLTYTGQILLTTNSVSPDQLYPLLSKSQNLLILSSTSQSCELERCACISPVKFSVLKKLSREYKVEICEDEISVGYVTLKLEWGVATTSDSSYLPRRVYGAQALVPREAETLQYIVVSSKEYKTVIAKGPSDASINGNLSAIKRANRRYNRMKSAELFLPGNFEIEHDIAQSLPCSFISKAFQRLESFKSEEIFIYDDFASKLFMIRTAFSTAEQLFSLCSQPRITSLNISS